MSHMESTAVRCVSGFHFSQKNQCAEDGPIAMYVCVCVFFLPNEENQCGRKTRNIEKTRPGLTPENTQATVVLLQPERARLLRARLNVHVRGGIVTRMCR